ncbi:MAG: geranylgeranyl reductase family protein [Acidimicrobiia bacterium]|nr:geranylgeranyl reductase family protein [Acidimicrobiia bacterium]
MATPDVLIVGGGPGGAATGHWLARNGIEAVVVEKKTFPRHKTCGDGLTPRAVRELIDMGFDFDVPELHRITGLRAFAGDYSIELPWPEHSVYPNWGAVMRRFDLDHQVAMLAEKQGAVVRTGVEASPIIEGGRLAAVELRQNGDVERVSPKVVVVADGSNSRFGRALGAYRRRDYPFGLAVRGYYASPNSSDTYLESQLDIRDRDGRSLPGYGWIFPLGDGTINIGVGVLSTFKGWKDINTSRVLDAYVEGLAEHWQTTLDDVVLEPTGGKLPMSFSIGPKAGPNWVLVGDAAGGVNPFNGEGIDYAYESGRMAAGYIADHLAGNPGALMEYPQALNDMYGRYHRVARAFSIAIGRPAMMRALVHAGLRSRPLMEWVLKVMANLLEPEELGMSERVYRAIEHVVALGPEPR